MSQIIRPDGEERSFLDRLSQRTGRREFIKWTGAGALGVVAVSACEQDPTRVVSELQVDTVTRTDTVAPPPPTFPSATLDFSNDFGVLNYAYALEQLEAAFYTMVAASANYMATFPNADERAVLEDLRDHEIAHREFYKAALGTNAIGALTPNFSGVNFNSRRSVLQTAQQFEDLGVAAYNGAARYLRDANFLTIAGKIVSVEARHAAAIRDILDPLSFAPNAFDPALPPSEVLGVAAPFIRNTVTLSNVPAS